MNHSHSADKYMAHLGESLRESVEPPSDKAVAESL
jgi:hypothetical protein